MSESAPGEIAAAIPHVHISWLQPFFEVLEESRVPWDELLVRARLPFRAAEDGSRLVPTSQVYDFVALAAQRAPLSDLGLRAGSRLDIAPLLPSPESTWSRPGVFRSLERFVEIALESSSNVEMWIESRSDPARTIEFFYLGTFDPRHPAFPTVEQYMVALMVRLTRCGAGPGWSPSQVNLRAPSVPKSAMRRLAGDARIRCARDVTSIAFPSREFAGSVHAFPTRSSPIWKRHRRRLNQIKPHDADIADSLRIVLGAYLPDGSPGIEQAARLARVSVRTLQRRLTEQGLTYSELIEDLRHDLAISLLRDPKRSVSEISRELGYRDPAILTRAFRRWEGQSPTAFRQSLQQR